MDIASALVGAQFARNALATPGTAVPADLKLATANLTMTPEANFTTYEAQGVLVPVGTVLGQEWSSGQIAGPIDYNEIVFLADNMLAEENGAEIDTSGAFEYLFVPSATSLNPTRAWSVEWGDGQTSLGWKATYAKIVDLTFNFNRQEATVAAALLAQRITDSITLTATPDTIAKQSVVPSTIDVYLATTWDLAVASTTRLDRAFSAAVGLTGRHMMIWPLRSDQTSFGGTVPGKLGATAALTLGAGTVSNGLLSAARVGSRRFMKIVAKGPQIGVDALAAPVYYLFELIVAIECTKIGGLADSDGVYVQEWEFTQVLDGTSGKFYQLRVICTIDPADM